MHLDLGRHSYSQYINNHILIDVEIVLLSKGVSLNPRNPPPHALASTYETYSTTKNMLMTVEVSVIVASLCTYK